MVAKRIIPCLDVKGGRTVKGINFEGLRDVGDAVELGSYYARSGADELVYLDISATREERGTFTRLVERIADEINIPFTVGGGIGSVEDASRLLDAGADKISVNSAAIASPSLIDSIASRYGNQFVVVAIDARMMEEGTWRATTHGGTRPDRQGALLVGARGAGARCGRDTVYIDEPRRARVRDIRVRRSRVWPICSPFPSSPRAARDRWPT